MFRRHNMRLLYITSARIPTEKAHGYQIAKMCESFAAHADVELWCPSRKSVLSEDVFTYYHLKPAFTIRKILGLDFFTYEKYLGRLSFWLQSVTYSLRLCTLPILYSKKDIVIYTREPEIAWVFGLRGYHVAYESHEVPHRKKLFSFLLARTQWIVVTNTFIQNEVRRAVPNAKILVSPNGVDLKIFAPSLSKQAALQETPLSTHIKSDEKILLYTGSFKTKGVEKGIADILSALTQMPHKKVLFVAVGGDQEDIVYYTAMAKAKGVLDRVLLYPRQSQNVLASFYGVADIVLMPFPDRAHYRYFMAPLKMFEYMASQKPIIATNLPSICEILSDENAFLVEPDDPQKLAVAISHVLEDANAANTKAQQAYADVQKYSWEKRAENIITFLHES